MMLTETKVFGGRLKDPSLLLKSSSGGAFTALSDVFLNNGDAVVCSSYNYRTHQQEYSHIISFEERDNARGSKYVQSIPGDVFRTAEDWLKANPDKQIIFFGMGCQAAGFQSYSEAKGFRERVTIVDIICHGSPSPLIWKEYIHSIEKKYGAVESLSFKDKRNGWKKPTAVVNIAGKEISLKQYVKIFYNRKALRLSCHKCPYASVQRTSDITIGDFWHIEEKIPQQYNEKGTSLFLIHTDKGLKLFEQVNQTLDWFESNTNDCWQINLERPTAISDKRAKFWEDYYSKGIDYIIKKYGNDSIQKRIRRKIKSFFN